MKLLLFAVLTFFIVSCSNDDKIHAPVVGCQCPPLNAPDVGIVIRRGDELRVYADTRLYIVPVEEGKEDYLIFVRGAVENDLYPFRFVREVIGEECEEYIIYYGKRISVI